MVNHSPFCPFVCAKEAHGTNERPKKGGLNTSIQSSFESLLPPYGVVCITHGCVLGWHMRVTLLARLYSIE